MFKNTLLPEVLMEAYVSPFKLQSDFARQFDQEVSALACMGYISTAEGPTSFGRKWRVTGIGLEKLRKLGLL